MSICDECCNYVYDEQSDYYSCDVDLDEDEMMRFLTTNNFECPYFRRDDEYEIVRKQK